MSRITGSLGKGLAEATFDDEFQVRQQEERMNQPKNVVAGVASGAATFVKGVGSGLIGIVKKPIEGAKEDGAKGFFIGIGKGAAGVVTKPIVGLFDGASKGLKTILFFSFLFLLFSHIFILFFTSSLVASGISNTTTMFDTKFYVSRRRYPRFIEPNKVLRDFDPLKAEGAHFLREIAKEFEFQDVYIMHVATDYDKAKTSTIPFVLVSNKHIASFKKKHE